MNAKPVRISAAWLCVLACLAAAGCGASAVSQRLEGVWVGRPDPEAGVVKRPSAAPGADATRGEANPSDTRPGDAAAGLSGRTDLEAFDFEITLDFARRGVVTMWLDGGQRIDGSWKVLSVDGGVALIELTDRPPESPADKAAKKRAAAEGAPAAPPAAEQPKRTQRRFELRLDPERDRFTLQEEGADRRFGRLLFEKRATTDARD
ncbi:MAG: hypothetical protein AAF790_04480 [Planctomycetota bacterium]